MPTLKQQKVATELVENGGNWRKAMISAGYSKAATRNPHKVRNAKGFQELVYDGPLSPVNVLSALADEVENGSGLARVNAIRLSLELYGATVKSKVVSENPIRTEMNDDIEKLLDQML